MRTLIVFFVLAVAASVCEAQWVQTTLGSVDVGARLFRNEITSPVHSVSFFDENRALACGGAGTILRTEDGGKSWVCETSGTNEWLSSVTIASTDVAIVVGQRGIILRSKDGGRTWESRQSPTGEPLNSVFFANRTVGCAVGGNGAILRTTDCGDTWTPQTSGTTAMLTSVYLTSSSLL